METRTCPNCGRTIYGATDCAFCRLASSRHVVVAEHAKPPHPRRPRWLLPALIAASVLAGAAVVGAVWAMVEHDSAVSQAEAAYQEAVDTLDQAQSQPADEVSEETEKARRKTVKAGIRTLQIAVQTYAVDHGDRYPRPSSGRQLLRMLRPYVDSWPDNPYTGEPMGLGSGSAAANKSAGDFSYGVSEDGRHFRLIGWGPNQTKIIVVP